MPANFHVHGKRFSRPNLEIHRTAQQATLIIEDDSFNGGCRAVVV